MSSEMTPEAFRVRPEDCPSELELDQYYLGELSSAENQRIEAELAKSEFARDSLKLREEGFAAFPHLNVDEMVAEIHEKAATVDRSGQEQQGSLVERFARRWLGSGMLVAAGVACLAIFLQPSADEPHGEFAIRSKGGAPSELRVHRKTADGAEQAGPETVFQAGDQIRFVVDISADGHGMLVSYDNKQRKTVLFPSGKEESIQIEKKAGDILPGGFTLDQSVGSEWVFWIRCDAPFKLSDLRFGTAPGILIPSGSCDVTSFELKKE